MFKRKVFYLGGFDPRGGRFYHQLLTEQLAAHNTEVPSGESRLTLGPRRREGANMGWTVTDDAGAVRTDFTFLAWDDIVRKGWIRGGLPLARAMIGTYRRFVRFGEWHRIKVPTGSKITLAYPGLALLVMPLVIGLVLWAVAAAVLGFGLAVPGRAVAALLVPAFAAGFAIGIPLARRIHALWLLRFIVFNDQLARGRHDPALDTRLAGFAALVAAAFDGEFDEVLLVTHSNGSILAMPLMAELAALRGPQLPANFALVTLGNSITLVTFRADALAFRAAVDRLAEAGFRWLDLGSMTDGAAIPLVDPWQCCRVSRPAGLIQLSPRWFRYCDPATYAARRRDKYLTHFDYLRRLDRPSPLDYLGLTCSVRPLPASIAAFEAENA